MKLDELSGKKPMDILVDVGDLSIPIDLDLILDKLGVRKIPSSFEDLEEKIEKKPGSIYGLVLFDDKDVGIFYKKNDELAQKRYTIAHELGHCCLHGDVLEENHIEMLCEEPTTSKDEKEADIFAGELLIPEDQLKDIHAKLFLPSLKKLCEIFEVPEKLMLQRLGNLKMTYYDDEKEKLILPML